MMDDKPAPALVYTRVSTGLSGLDVMLNGGLPKGRVVLIRGTPGLGKTILCAQYLYKGAKQNERGLFVTLEETREQLIREMYLVGMDFRDLEKDRKIVFLDASPIRHVPAEVKLGTMSIGKRDFSLVALLNKMKTIAVENGIQRIVIDPLTALSIQYPDDNQRRIMILDLIEVLAGTEATCLMTEDMGVAGTKKTEEYSVHGVIHMRPMRAGSQLVKTIEIVKMRETNHDDQARLYRITEQGIIAYPDQNVLALL